jgi:hypothetical protein
MALQASGPISISDIQTELGNTSGSLSTLAQAAGFTAPYRMSDFYGYTHGGGGGPASWDLADLQIAYDFRDAGILTGSTINNLASVNPGMTMTVSGTPSIVGGQYMLFNDGDFASGDYDAFRPAFPNTLDGSQSSDFTFFIIVQNPSTALKLSGFDYAGSPNVRLGYQESSTIANRAYEASFYQYAFTGTDIGLGNLLTGGWSMQGLRGTHLGGQDFTFEWIVNGGNVADTMGLPAWLEGTSVQNIAWDFPTQAWLKEKPSLNAQAHETSPNATGRHSMTAGLFIYKRALSDTELASIWTDFNSTLP